jgi:hypothetical protein
LTLIGTRPIANARVKDATAAHEAVTTEAPRIGRMAAGPDIKVIEPLASILVALKSGHSKSRVPSLAPGVRIPLSAISIPEDGRISSATLPVTKISVCRRAASALESTSSDDRIVPSMEVHRCAPLSRSMMSL